MAPPSQPFEYPAPWLVIKLTVFIANGGFPAIIDHTVGPDGKARERRIFEGSRYHVVLNTEIDKEYKICYPFDTDRLVILAFSHECNVSLAMFTI